MKKEESEDPRIRDHEKQQKTGLYFLYIPLYLVATASAAGQVAGQVTSAATQETDPTRYAVLVFSAVTIVYVTVGIIVGIYVWWKQRQCS